MNNFYNNIIKKTLLDKFENILKKTSNYVLYFTLFSAVTMSINVLTYLKIKDILVIHKSSQSKKNDVGTQTDI
jgi:hypothetical protein